MNKKLFLASAMMALAILGGCAKTDISAEDCEDNLCQKAINDAGNDTPTPDIPDIDTEDEPEPDIPDIDTEDEREPDIPDTECTVDNDCELNGTIPSCQEGICTYECSSGFYDLNDDLSLAEEGNGCEYACAISNDGNEACDEVDNDCDGNTDEDFDLIEDLEHCGTCGNACAFDNAVPLCNEGRCVFEECNPGYLNENEDQEDGCEILEDAPECEILQDCPVVRNAIPDCTNDECVYRCEQNFHDINNDLGLAQNSNGCEYACTISNDGVEACDQTDNDCDGEADEDFDLTEDINNCGTCGETCEFDNAVPLCSDGECGFEECLPGYLDENEDPDDGCEALENPPDCEVDNDCPTIPGTVPSCEEELCSYRCADGFYDINEDLGLTENGNGCEYACTISNDGVEICDEADNDCDGDIDETFNLQIDENNCGTCDNVCTFDHATPLCSDGECGFEECEQDFYDINEDPEDGCEYFCEITNDGIEVCDTVDNDCNGEADDNFDLQIDENNCGTCDNVCTFDHATPLCSDGECGFEECEQDFYDINEDPEDGCEYACEFDNDEGIGDRCDGRDNDCDSDVDEDESPEGFTCVGPDTYTIGSPQGEDGRSDDESLFTFALDYGFLGGLGEITQEEFERVTGFNPSFRSDCPQCPVESVTYLDAVNYSNLRSTEEEGRTPCYACRNGNEESVPCADPTATEAILTSLICDGYRLPTEAEWEIMDRAGCEDRNYGRCFDPELPLSQIAWFADNSGNTTQEVGQLTPNAWGFTDTSGNVREWTESLYTNQHGEEPLEEELRRVHRGGSFGQTDNQCRSGDRDKDIWFCQNPDDCRNRGLGFRVVRGVPQ